MNGATTIEADRMGRERDDRTVTERAPTWIDVCASATLKLDRGVACLADGQQVAVFRVSPRGQLFAVSNFDPFSGAFVVSRGLIGSRTVDGRVRPMVTSPMYKDAFDLETGVCLDDDSQRLDRFAVSEHDGVVRVSARPIGYGGDLAPRAP